MTHYSVEWIPTNFPSHWPKTWNQYALTRYRFLAKVYLIEAKVVHKTKFNEFRIREV